mmetsp:Transcript_10776/g.7550  ORF Transcript_10776/g.7550 Transcript_10776/m.7550 type:complete len:141 (+) Transcript_10776:1453-1875(+)
MSSKSNNEFLENISQLSSSYSSLSYNYLFAFANGDIGYTLASGLPVRNITENPKLYEGTHVFDGTTSENDWTSVMSLDMMPFGSNPVKGFFVSANNRALPDIYENDLGAGSIAGHNYRAKRIEDLIKLKKGSKDLSFEYM